jgi:hypothetical protein
MRIPLSIIVVIGLTFLVILGALRLVADFLVMDTHRQPSFPDEFSKEGRDSEEGQFSVPVEAGKYSTSQLRNITGS